MNAKIFSEKQKDPSAVSTGVMKWFLVNILYLLALGISLFLSAGRLDWQWGWLYLGVIVTGQTATTLLLLPTNPTLLGERSWMQKGSKAWDTVIVSLSDAGWFATLIIAGLDTRLNWSPRLPFELPVIGLMLLGLGYLLFLWAIASNRYFSSFMRIQTDRGHTVETGGPYNYVRHPGYVGALLLYGAGPLALTSVWAFIPATLIIALFVYRTAREDRTLQEDLDGYVAYALRVRYRLIPGIW